jgi:hypothetical protein
MTDPATITALASALATVLVAAATFVRALKANPEAADEPARPAHPA